MERRGCIYFQYREAPAPGEPRSIARRNRCVQAVSGAADRYHKSENNRYARTLFHELLFTFGKDNTRPRKIVQIWVAFCRGVPPPGRSSTWKRNDDVISGQF